MHSGTGVEARGIVMSFGGAPVLKGVDLDLRRGEIHAITGENGAGKSTLAKIIAGVYVAREGNVSLDGHAVNFRNPREALQHGIALVHQEPLSFPDLTIMESMFVGHLPRGTGGTVDWPAISIRSKAVMDRVGLKQLPTAPTSSLSVADQQLVELAAALLHEASVIILDETTASLTPSETANLFSVVRRLRDEGCAIAFVSHKLDEVFSLCDRITILRDGAKVGEVRTVESSPSAVVRMMVGRDIDLTRTQPRSTLGEIRLSVRMQWQRTGASELALDVRGGEIVVIAGLVGSGRTELIEWIAGIGGRATGQIHIDGNSFRRDPHEALRAGIALVPEDRRKHGMLLPWSIQDNGVLPILGRLTKVWKATRKAQALMVGWISQLRIVSTGPNQSVEQLSGGNQQKVVIAKALLAQPKVLLVDEPTRGVDVGAKAEIHGLLREFATNGMAILAVSSDLSEVLTIADRVVVMRDWAIAGELAAKDLTEEAIMRLATGQVTHAA